MKTLSVWLAVALLTVAAQGYCATEEETIRRKLQQALPDQRIDSIAPGVVPGIFEVQLANGPMLYSTADGEHFFLGDLFAVQPSAIVNLDAQRRNGKRRELLAGIEREQMIIFSPAVATKTSVTVFTDVDCGYCQKFHSEVPAMNSLGIEVRYLAFPRAGVGSESYRKIASAWCAEDPQTAITRLKRRENIAENVCDENPVAEQLALGEQMGIQGTPALVLEGGQLLPGYLSATDLAKRLGIQ